MVLLFISFLADLDNNDKAWKDGRSENCRPRSYRGFWPLPGVEEEGGVGEAPLAWDKATPS